MTHAQARGSMALQLVLVTPLLLLLVAVAVYAGRLEEGQSRVDDAAHAAARAASLERSPATAQAAAQRVATADLAPSPSCRALTVAFDLSAFRPGGTVAVTVSCAIERGDLGLLPIPGVSSVTARSVSVLDIYRQVSP